MKIVGIIFLALLVLFVISQIWAQSQLSGIEMYPYTVTKDYDDFELRTYEEANFIYVTMDSETYKGASRKGFGTLAGYIFGGNEAGEKIAMTSPVEMEMDEGVTMKFLVPAKYDINEMPKPDNSEVKFMTEKERKLAVMTFSGFANDDKILEHKERLFLRLAEEGLEHNGQWSFMGYDPPFKLINRRNEVVVELL